MIAVSLRRLICFVLAGATLSTGCAGTLPPHVPGITIVEEASTVNCEYLDNVHGTSAWYGLFANKGYENARLEALEQAVAIGASHLIWLPIAQPYGSTEVRGKAFRCTKR